MRNMLIAAGGLLALALSVGPVAADHDKGKGQGNAYGHDKDKGGPGGWVPFGNAERISLGRGQFAVALTSDLTSEDMADWYGGIAITPKTNLTFADIQRLSADYNLVDGAGGGSPRFQITVLNSEGQRKNIFVYLGTPPNFADGATEEGEWESTGNLIDADSTDKRFDISQLVQGPYLTYAEAVEAVGDLQVVEVSLVVDSGWFFADGTQTVLVDNVRVNDAILSANGNSKK